MKRLGNIWNKICSKQNIEKSIKMVTDQSELVDIIQQKLITETYSFGPYTKLIVHEPKERIIHYPVNIYDKIYHKCLLNVIGEYLISKLPDDSFASIKGRGITKACNKIKKFIKTKNNWYYIQTDVKKYYDNIDHNILKDILRRYIKCKKTLKMLDQLIDSYPNGLPIGNHTSQYFANIYLAQLGHKIKEYYKVPFMIIYMDDLLFMFPTKSEANQFKQILIKEIENINLTLKSNLRVSPVSSGINMLGYVFYPTHTRLRKRIKLNMKKQFKRFQYSDDKIFKLKLASYYGWCSHGDCKHLLKKTFKNRYKMFEFKKLSDCGFFGLPKDRFVSIKELYNKEIGFIDYENAFINNQNKVVIKFVYLDDQETLHYTITKSKVIMDRIKKDKQKLPFIATFKTDKYSYYE